MTTLRSVNSSETAQAKQANDDSNGNSTLRDAVLSVESLQSATDNHRLEYRIVHRVPGRLRLKVFGLRQNFGVLSACLSTLIEVSGIEAVRSVKYGSTAIVSYDPSLLSESEVLNAISDLSYDDNLVVGRDKVAQNYLCAKTYSLAGIFIWSGGNHLLTNRAAYNRYRCLCGSYS